MTDDGYSLYSAQYPTIYYFSLSKGYCVTRHLSGSYLTEELGFQGVTEGGDGRGSSDAACDIVSSLDFLLPAL